MNRIRAWGVAAALTAGAVAPVAAAEPPKTTADERPWYKRLFVAPKPAAATGPAPRSRAVAAAPGQGPVSQPLSPDAIQTAFSAESDAYLRRLDVCVKLRQVALDRNDSALTREVEELERQAKAIYEQRVSALGLSKAARAPLPLPSAGLAASLDLAPEKPADPKVTAAKLVAPAAPVPVSGSAEVREVKP